MAITSTPLAACRTFSAAPLPRPPQPIRPTLMVSLLAAWTPPVASRVAVAAAADVLRNWRREVWLFLLICCEPPGGEGEATVCRLRLSTADAKPQAAERRPESGITCF